MRKNRSLMVSLIGILLAAAMACGPSRMRAPTYEPEEPEPEPEVEAAPRPPPRRVRTVSSRPFLWSIESGERPSYLFGTMHSGVSLDEALPAQHLEKIDSAHVVFQEIDPESDIEALALAASLPDQQRLSDFVSARAWNRLSNELLHEVDIVRLRTLRPWVPMFYLTKRRARALRRAHSGPSMDRALYDYVRQQGVELRFLETVAEQAAALGSVPDEEMGRIVRDMVLEPERLDTELGALIEAYLDADAGAVADLVHNNSDPDVRAFHEALFGGRNEQWLQTIEPMLAEGGVFVSVGLGHLLGRSGLVARLRRAGHAVRRIR